MMMVEDTRLPGVQVTNGDHFGIPRIALDTESASERISAHTKNRHSPEAQGWGSNMLPVYICFIDSTAESRPHASISNELHQMRR